MMRGSDVLATPGYTVIITNSVTNEEHEVKLPSFMKTVDCIDFFKDLRDRPGLSWEWSQPPYCQLPVQMLNVLDFVNSLTPDHRLALGESAANRIMANPADVNILVIEYQYQQHQMQQVQRYPNQYQLALTQAPLQYQEVGRPQGLMSLNPIQRMTPQHQHSNQILQGQPRQNQNQGQQFPDFQAGPNPFGTAWQNQSRGMRPFQMAPPLNLEMRSPTGRPAYNRRPTPYDRGGRDRNSGMAGSRYGGPPPPRPAWYFRNGVKDDSWNSYRNDGRWNNRGPPPFARRRGGGRGGSRGGRYGSVPPPPFPPRGPPRPGRCVLMRGLPFKASEDNIREFFEPLVPTAVHIIFESSGRPSGIAKVEFASGVDVTLAMAKHKERMEHRYIELFVHSV